MSKPVRRPLLRWLRRLVIAALAAGLAGNLVGAAMVYGAIHFAPPGATGPARWLPAKPANRTTPADRGFAFDTIRVAGGAGELELWHLPNPRGRGLVAMFHGHMATKAALLEEAAALHRLGFAIVLVDFRGSGGSDGATTTIGWAEAEDVMQATAAARALAGPRPLVLFGTSMGAVAILRAASLTTLAAEAAILEVPFDTLENAVANRFRARGLPPYPATPLVLLYGGLFLGLDAGALRPVDYAPALRMPALVLKGERDPTVTEAEIRGLVARLPGPKQLALLPRAGHFGLLRDDRSAWLAAVAGFLDTHLPR